jgi:two-component system, cell cycle sensor histidine kinase PleC
MRSAETSGVTATGTLAPGNRARPAGRSRPASASPFRRFADISGTSLAVGATALIAAALFTTYDVLHTAAEARALEALLRPGELTMLPDGAWERGLVAFALAILVSVLTFRRRPAAYHGASVRTAVEGIIATIPFGIALWTDAGRLIACNEPYLQRLRRDGAGPAGRLYQDALKHLARDARVKIVRDGDSRRLMELYGHDGSCLLLDERPLDIGGFVTVITDITERRQTDLLLDSIQQEQRTLQQEQRTLARRYHEEKLKAEAASRAKTSFLAHLSHDIRTPLNHIIGFAELMRHQTYGPVGDERYLGYLDMIKGSGEKLLGSFATILELAELEGGNKPLHEEVVDVDELMATVTRRFADQAERAGLQLGIGSHCSAELLADRFCLERMLGNLLENAVRFTPSGGRVTVAAYAADDGVVLEVSDTGIGMTDEQLDRLSQPFVFGDAAFTREHDGAGLGIAISRAIAELSGGRLAIDSRPAIGTTVAIALPSRQYRAAAQAA